MIGNKNEIIKFLLEQEDKIYEIKEYREKRTLTQNSYYWKLLSELAKTMRIPATELHFEMIKKSCPFEEYLIYDQAELRALEYYEVKGKIKRDNKIFKIVRVYVGSSKLDTKEMGILLDNLIEECTAQGIETMTPRELEELRSREKEINNDK